MDESSVRAVIYVRVSTDSQERDGTSLETQQRACEEHARAAEWDVVETIPDVASGYNLERSGLDHVRELVRQGVVDLVVSYAVDRLSRNQNHIGILLDEVQQAGAQLEFVTERFEDSATGEVAFGLGLGTLVLATNTVLLASYTFGCHSLRHFVGGGRDRVSENPARFRAYRCVSCLNQRHMTWAWCSLFSVGFSDLYVRLCSMGIWTDWRIL